MNRRGSSTRVLSIMQELHQLREKVSAFSEKNRELAKALTITKQELTKGESVGGYYDFNYDLADSGFAARSAQSAFFSDRVMEWMKTHRKPVEVQHRAIQCSFKEVEQDTFASIEFNQLKKKHSVSPYHKRRTKKLFQSKRLSLAPITCTKAPTAFDKANVINALGVILTLCYLSILRWKNTCAEINSSATKIVSKSGVKRRLRQRDTNMSYVEPKLNTKLRRGDYYGLGTRTGPPTHQRSPLNVNSRSHSAKLDLKSASFKQQRLMCQSTSSRRSINRISYEEPKLNTKLRQGDKFTFT